MSDLGEIIIGASRRRLPTAAGRRVVLGWLLACALSLASLGCGGPAIVHSGTDGILSTTGDIQGRQRLRDIMTRAISPQIAETEVTDDALQYRIRQAIFGNPTGALLEQRIHFLNVGRAEVYENNVVIIWTEGNTLLAQFTFGNTQDAKTFADLLVSFRARRERGGAR